MFSKGQVWKLYKYSGLHTECIFARVMEDLTIFQNFTQGDGELLPNWHTCVGLWLYFWLKMHGAMWFAWLPSEGLETVNLRLSPFHSLAKPTLPLQFRRNLDSCNLAEQCDIPPLHWRPRFCENGFCNPQGVPNWTNSSQSTLLGPVTGYGYSKTYGSCVKRKIRSKLSRWN